MELDWWLCLTSSFTLQVAREQNLEKSLSKEALENDCSQIVEERRALVNTIYSLRKELRRAKVLQDKVGSSSCWGSWMRQAGEAPAVSCLWSRAAAPALVPVFQHSVCGR